MTPTEALILKHGGIKPAARAEGVSPKAIRGRRAREYARIGKLGFKPVLPGYEIKQTATQTDAAGNVQKEWVQQRPERGAPFEMPPDQAIKGVSALVDGDGRLIQQWIKTRSETGDIIAAIKQAFDEYGGAAEMIQPPDYTDDRLLSVYPIADQHVGLLSWGKETGEDYDLKIGARRLRNCMSRLVGQAPKSKTAIILNLGDWQHTDDQKNMTPRGGNLLDVDSRYFKILTTGVQLMMDCVDMALQRHEKVLVRNLPGNHDPHASIALTVALSAFYSQNPRVTVDTDPSDFFYHRFGATLIGATHGHKMKPDRMAMTMAVNRREDWGETKHHWFLFGHIHHESAKEVGDVRCESFQTLAANDAFSHSHGYTSGKSLSSITLHYDEGEIGRHRVNVPTTGAVQ